MTSKELLIDDLAAQGDGVAHVGGVAVFVAGALPGERVRVEEEKCAHDACRARLLEVLTLSALRVVPPCPHFPRCGGCVLQHLSAEAYAAFKIRNLETAFARAKLPLPPMEPMAISPPHTRRRAQFAARRTKNGVILGFNEARSSTVVNVTSCSVLAPSLLAALPVLREHLEGWLALGGACDVHMTALESGLDVVLVGGPELGLESREKLGALAQALNVGSLSWRKWDRSQVEPIAVRAQPSVTFGQTTVPFPPASFLQATPEGQAALIDFVRARAHGRVLDLFCGLGTFGLSLGKTDFLHFCDIDGPALEALAGTLKNNPHARIEERNLIRDPVPAAVCDMFDCIIFDPPRGGAKAQAQEIAQTSVRTVLAVSCDPQSFARDARILIDGGFKLTALKPVDQFLWSSHLELAAQFER